MINHKSFQDLSINSKLKLIILSTNVMALIIAVVLFSLNEVISLRNSMAREYRALGNVVAANSAAPLVFNIEMTATETLNTLAVQPEIMVAVTYDAEGKRFAEYRRENMKNIPISAAMQADGIVFSLMYMDLYIPVISSTQQVGTVFMRVDTHRIYALLKNFSIITAFILLASLLGTYVVAMNMQSLISKPLINLAETATTVSEKGDFSIRAQEYGKDEVGVLVESFNKMLEQIQKRDVMLARHRDHLEDQVRLRTSELSAANRNLESTIIDVQRAKEAAESANKVKGEFLANMSHEIRTPLNAVINITEFLSQTPLNVEQKDFVDTIRASGDVLLGLVNDVLDFSRIDSGRLELESVPFNLRECVESAVEVLSARAAQKKLELLNWFEPSLDLTLLGDPTRLRQILMNLISNAVKFTEHGEIVVQVQATEHENKAEVLFSVRDTGIGIPADRINQLFQAFTQVDASTTRKYGGSGLGLAISRHLCGLMGGKMWVESELGKGSTFFFNIVAEITASVDSKYSSEPLSTDLHGKRILLVDDNATNLLILARQTQQWGMIPVPATGGREALAKIQAGDPYDAAILDMWMPDMDGETLASEIMRLPSPPTFPLIMLTSMGTSALHGNLFAAYLTKPLKGGQLLEVLWRVFHTEAADVPPPTVIPSPPATPPSLDTKSATALSSMTVLLAEDNAVNQKVASILLKRMGYTVTIANNGAEAVQHFEASPFDTILMDVQMPEMDGMQATQAIRERWPELPHRPYIIAMTAHAMRGYREQCIAAGMDGYVSKPIKPDALQEALRDAETYLERKRAGELWLPAMRMEAGVEPPL